MESEQILRVVSRAWGRQKGYAFFPTISGTAKTKKERIMSYRENRAFFWPRDKELIIAHLDANRDNDVYWCPSLFEMPKRKMELAMDEHALWADLDEVDPRQIEDYPPTIAWETSPGRWQALWLIAGGDMQGASWAGRENQQLTYYLGADQSGWDTTQLLRLPTWNNHKPDYRDDKGKPAHGKLLWKDGRQYLPDEFGDLPEVPNGAGAFSEILEDEIDHIDRHAVWGRVRLKVSNRVRELVAARQASGDRSDVLWEIERDLADAGCSVTEIVAIVRATIWNKFAGRSDELRRLTTEAHKAISQRAPEDTEKLLEEMEQRPKPTNLFILIRNLKPPTWLIRDVLTQGAVGFIAGQPKSFKSWVGLDMGLSVASGQPFLGYFPVERPGPVLYIQEEDSSPLIKARVGKVWPGKIADVVTRDPITGDIIWLPPKNPEEYWGSAEIGEGVDIDAYIGQGFTISDEGWQSWLDEVMADKAAETAGGYRLLLLDPMMMMAGDVEENQAQKMTTKVFRPLKELARKWDVAVQMIHHMKKGDPKAGPQRGGQLLLGSVANHAWAEDSLYFKLGRGGDVICEQESKNAPVAGFRLTGIRNRRWTPSVVMNRNDADTDFGIDRDASGTPSGEQETRRDRATKQERPNKTLEALRSLGPGSHTAKAIADAAGTTVQAVYSAEKRYPAIVKDGTKFKLEET